MEFPEVRIRMPFTPFHMGPGALFKACMTRNFSLLLFGFTQVLIDIEPLIRIIRRDEVVHGFTHTYIGATLIAFISWLIGKPLFEFALTLINRVSPVGNGASPFINRRAAILGVTLGAYSHIVLDSIMHADMCPLAPFTAANALLRIVSVRDLHLFCIVSGAIGLFMWGFIAVAHRRGRL